MGIAERTALFLRGDQAARSAFKWHNPSARRLAAWLYAAEGRTIDHAAVRAALNEFKRSVGALSPFRGSLALPLAAMAALRDRPEEAIGRAVALYGWLKQAGFRGCDFLAAAAMTAACRPGGAPDELAGRAWAFFRGMRADHPMLTGRGDYLFAMLMALSPLAVDEGVRRVETLYRSLRAQFGAGIGGNGVQALAQMLVLTGHTDAPPRVPAIRNALRALRRKLESEYTLPLLGALALLPGEADAVARSFAATFDELRRQQGMSRWAVSAQELSAYAAGLEALALPSRAAEGAMTHAIASIIAAQQAALVAAMAAPSG